MAVGRAKRLMALMATAAAVGGLLAGCGTAPGKQKPAGGPGAATPQEAVGDLLSSLSQGRYDQALLDITPGEYAALQHPLNDMMSQLVRLGIVTPSTSLSHVPGLSVVFSNPTFSVSTLSPGVDFVQFTGGTVTGTATPSQLPVGPKLEQVLAPVIAKAHPVTKTSPLSGNPDAGLAAVEDNGRWYVSLGYSVAEAARRSHHMNLPSALLDIQPSGASSPDGAVQDLMTDIGHLDVTQLLALTPPDELPALRDYASLFLPAVKSKLAGLASWTVSVTSPALHDETKPDGTLVHLDALKIVASNKTMTVTYTKGCATIDTGATFQVCKSNIQRFLGLAHLPQAATNLVNIILSLKPDTGIMTVEEGGKWFVSPVRTLLDDSDALLAALTPQQVDQMVSDIQGLIQLVPHMKVTPPGL